MEITIKINGRFVSVEVSAEVADYLEQAKRNNRKLYRERQRYWEPAGERREVAGGVGSLHQLGIGGRRQAGAHRPPQL